MPSRYDNERVPRLKGHDKRIKLSNEDKDAIKMEYVPYDQKKNNNQKMDGSIHSLAQKYGVSRRLISSIVKSKPIKQLTYKEKKELNWKSETREKRNQYSQAYRKHQKEIYKLKEQK